MSYAKENIKKWQRREAIELWRAFGYHLAEFVVLLAIFAYGLFMIGLV